MANSSDRQPRVTVLNSIKSALANKSVIRAPLSAGVATVGAPGTPMPVPQNRSQDTLDLFEDMLADYRARVIRSEAGELPLVIAGLVSQHKIKSVVVPPGLDATWYQNIGEVKVVFDDGSIPFDELASIDAVITGCTCAIAETGTLVLSGQPYEGRRAVTLLPDFHICVVRSEVVMRRVKNLFSHVTITDPITLISGPSATSDIELKRVEGVHGPRNLFVVIVS